MKVFISWSGETAKAFAKVLHGWLPSVLQAVKPFFSPDDIAKGARWGIEVGTELEASQVGIIVVILESLSAPWIMFEAGALSKNVGRAKVVPILLDLEPDDVRGPLMQFQCARFDQQEMKRMLRMLNSELGDSALTDDVLESAFSMRWPILEKETSTLLRQTNKNQPINRRTEKELLEEILGLARSIAHHQLETRHSPQQEPSLSEPDEGVAESSGALTLASVRKRLALGGNLVGANLMNLRLAGMDLSDANLRGANLVQVNLARAKLINADLDGANLERAVMDGADLNGAKISRTNLWGASMRDVENLSLVKSMDDANFYQVDLNEKDQRIVAEHKTLSISTYPDLMAYYYGKGMSRAEVRDLFLWTAHAYPGEGPWSSSLFSLVKNWVS